MSKTAIDVTPSSNTEPSAVFIGVFDKNINAFTAPYEGKDKNFYSRIIRNFSLSRPGISQISVHHRNEIEYVEDYLAILVPNFIPEEKVIHLLKIVLKEKLDFLALHFAENASKVQTTVKPIFTNHRRVLDTYSIVAQLIETTGTKQFVSVIRLTDGYGPTRLDAEVPKTKSPAYVIEYLLAKLPEELELIKKSNKETQEKFALPMTEDAYPAPASISTASLSTDGLANHTPELSTDNLPSKASSPAMTFSASASHSAAATLNTSNDDEQPGSINTANTEGQKSKQVNK